MQKINQWHQYPTADELAKAVCHLILEKAEQAIANKGEFKLVLAGGSTPEKIYHLLAKAEADWQKWKLYYGDERCLPADDKDRNSVMAYNTLISKVAIPTEQNYIMATENGPVTSASQYRSIIAEVDRFDLVLLGMGEDGHTASLFPGQSHDETDTVHEVYNSPKPPPERITLSAKTLANTDALFYIITGESKQEAVKQWKDGTVLPVATIAPVAGVDIYIDQAALI